MLPLPNLNPTSSTTTIKRRHSFFAALRPATILARCAALAFALVGSGPTVWAQDSFPVREVKIVVGYPAGGGVDGIARALANHLTATLGQSVIIENKPGATGTIAAATVAKAAPDGYTLYLCETGFLTAQTIMPSVKLDATNDFTPIGSIGLLPLALIVNPGLQVQTTQDLIDLLKANPGKYSYGSAGVGTLHHFIFEMFIQAANLKVAHIPYKGGSPMVPDLVEGRIQIGMLSSAVAAPLVDTKRLRALAVTTSRSVNNMASVPPLANTIPGFNAAPALFLLAPKGTSEPIIKKLNSALHAALNDPSLMSFFAQNGALPHVDTSEELARTIIEESKRWKSIAISSGAAKQ